MEITGTYRKGECRIPDYCFEYDDDTLEYLRNVVDESGELIFKSIECTTSKIVVTFDVALVDDLNSVFRKIESIIEKANNTNYHIYSIIYDGYHEECVFDKLTTIYHIDDATQKAIKMAEERGVSAIIDSDGQLNKAYIRLSANNVIPLRKI